MDREQLIEHVIENQRAVRASRFTLADDRLSRAASAVWHYHREVSDGADDIRAFHAPSECMGLVTRAAERRLAASLAACGYTELTLQVALNHRIGPRSAYRLGL